MLKLFKPNEKPKAVTTTDVTNDLIKLIDLINEEAKKATIEYQSVKEPIDTEVVLLKQLGFSLNPKVTKHQQAEAEKSSKKAKKELLEKEQNYINEYRIKYPGYKFVPSRIYEKILTKYDLYNGPVSIFKREVPSKNLEEINQFNMQYKQYKVYHYNYSYPNLSRYVYKGTHKECTDYVNARELLLSTSTKPEIVGTSTVQYRFDIIKELMQYKIAAPKEDFADRDVYGRHYEIQKDKRHFQMEVDDPIVTVDVDGGVIIVTAWDKEAQDPDILNHENN